MTNQAMCKNNRYGKSAPMGMRRGFTLIELLVVIAIIMILAAILFPVFMRARDMGRRASCISNMKQLGLGMQMYTEDYDGGLPGATDGQAGEGQEGGWVYYSQFAGVDGSLNYVPPVFDVSKGSIYTYIKNTQVYICPSDGPGKQSGETYAYNQCVGTKSVAGVALPTGISVGKRQSEFENTEKWMLLCEEDAWAPVASLSGLGNGGTNDAYLDKTQDFVSKRHSGGSVVLFLDGHVKWQTTDAIYSNHFQTGGVDVSITPDPDPCL